MMSAWRARATGGGAGCRCVGAIRLQRTKRRPDLRHDHINAIHVSRAGRGRLIVDIRHNDDSSYRSPLNHSDDDHPSATAALARGDGPRR